MKTIVAFCKGVSFFFSEMFALFVLMRSAPSDQDEEQTRMQGNADVGTALKDGGADNAPLKPHTKKSTRGLGLLTRTLELTIYQTHS
jgi:hypothetical protein